MSSASTSPYTPAFDMASAAPSTSASSPPTSEYSPLLEIEKEEEEEEQPLAFIKGHDFNKDWKKLQHVLERTGAYTQMLQMQMNKLKNPSAFVPADDSPEVEPVSRGKRKTTGRRSKVAKGRKRVRGEEDEVEDEEPRKRVRVEEDKTSPVPSMSQPKMITGATLKDYQLEGVQWMIALDQNGISGILADEMGLGKTLQTIAFNAYLREWEISKHFLIVCPLSVLHNWADEYKKFAPDIPICIYHGNPQERAELRKGPMKPYIEKGKRRGNESKADDDWEEFAKFPTVLTTYEMIIKDRVHLEKYNWGYIVVDEGHRLKNLDCRLMREIKKYPSAGRLILTGTPLQNNLSELWALMNFVLPDIFDDLGAFQRWFDVPTLQSTLGTERTSEIVSALHNILRPFLLRRLKVDVLGDQLPPKKEYVIYTPLTLLQKEMYKEIIDGKLRDWLAHKSGGNGRLGLGEVVDVEKPRETRAGKGRGEGKGKGKGKKKVDYKVLEGDDDEYFEALSRGELDRPSGVPDEDVEEMGRKFLVNKTKKQINTISLRNTVMQLRKVCSHPFLFDWPLDSQTQEPLLTNELVNASGKMMILELLLDELFRSNHKVLLFSQFTMVLDVIEDWATELKGWKICRIDGSTPPLDRREQMRVFQEGGDSPDAPILFLLSTRAGGLGINLTAADTVIFYDQDWNPQMDAQAQDRAHRIGQKNPVLVFRLVSAHTIEDRMLKKATFKRRLEALVIAKGQFKAPTRGQKKTTSAEMTASFLQLEGEKIDVVDPSSEEGKARKTQGLIGKDELDQLLDRSEAVFRDRPTSDSKDVEDEEAGKKFEVYQRREESEGNDLLDTMFGDDGE